MTPNVKVRTDADADADADAGNTSAFVYESYVCYVQTRRKKQRWEFGSGA
jgi:hypothetical protein